MRVTYGLLALALTGCSGRWSAPDEVCVQPSCKVAPMQLAAEISPASNDLTHDLIDLDVASLVLDPDRNFTIQLDAPRHIVGTVSLGKGTTPLKTADATVVASRPSRIPGRPDRSYQAKIDADGNYVLAVPANLAGESYTLRVVSTDATLFPPEEFLASTDSEPTHFSFSLTDPSLLFVIQGHVIDPVNRPIAGLRMQGVDVVTKQVLTTSAVTDADGFYALKLAPSKVARASLRLTARPTDTAPPDTPQFEKVIDLSLVPTAATSLVADLPTPALLATVPFKYRVTGVSSSGAVQPVPGARCQFTIRVADDASSVTAIYQTTVETALDGQVTAQLIPSSAQDMRSYQLVIAPGATSQFQSDQFTVDVGPPDTSGGYGREFVLTARAQVLGQLIIGGMPVKDVVVNPSFSSLADAVVASSSGLIQQFTGVTTDSWGRFAISLDKGTFDLGLLPPITTGLPRLWLTNTRVASSDIDLGPIEVPQGVMAHAIVLDGSNGTRVAGASVQVYLVPAGNSTCAVNELACLSAPRVIAEGTTTFDGSAPIVLPASQ